MAAADSPTPRTTVAAIVVNWRQAELTSAAVASLEAQSGLGEVDLAIVIVDNGSGDGSVELLRSRHPAHRVVALENNGGFGAGVNAGIRAVDADAYVLLNNDAVAEPSFVGALVEALSAHPHAGAVTARIVLRDRYRRLPEGAGDAGAGAAVLVGHDGGRWAVDPAGLELLNSTGNESTRSGNGRDRDWLVPVTSDARPAGPVMGFSGGAAALRGSALAEVGLFDESLFMYYEDTDLSWRLRAAGWDIRYEPSAVVRHAHAASSGTGSDLFRFYNERNRVLVAAKNAPVPVVVAALGRTVVATGRAAMKALAAGGSGAAGREARLRLRSLRAAVTGLPGALGERRRR